VIRRQEIRPLKPSDDYGVLTRSVAYALRDMGRSAGVLTRQIGGLRTLRDFANTGRDPLQPNPARVQRDALDALAKGLFAAESVTLSPTLQRRMAPDFDERSEALFAGDSAGDSSYSVVPSVMGLQRAVLNQLMSDGVAARVIDNGSKVDRDAKGADAPLQLSELYSRLTREIWSELSTGGEIAPMRRELQREHINRLSAQLLRPTSSSRADTRSQLRAQAQWLLARMQSAKARAGADAQTRAHLDDATDSLSQALGAKLQRQGV
jgi:hypothetical protein